MSIKTLKYQSQSVAKYYFSAALLLFVGLAAGAVIRAARSQGKAGGPPQPGNGPAQEAQAAT